MCIAKQGGLVDNVLEERRDMGAAIERAIGQYFLEMNKVSTYLAIVCFLQCPFSQIWNRPSAVKRSYP